MPDFFCAAHLQQTGRAAQNRLSAENFCLNYLVSTFTFTIMRVETPAAKRMTHIT